MDNHLKSRPIRRAYNQDSVARWLAGDDLDSSANKKYTTPKKPFATQPFVFGAVNEVCTCASAVPLVASTVDGDLIESGPLVDFLGSLPQEANGFIYQYIAYFLASGEVHLVWDLEKPGAGTLDVFGKDSMKCVVSADGLTLLGWVAVVPDRDGKSREYVLSPDSVNSWISFNPYNRWRGLSRLDVLAITMAEDGEAAEHNATLLARGGGPRGLLVTPDDLLPQQAEELEQRFEAKYGRTRNVGKVAVLSRGASWQSIAQSNRDLLLIDNRKFTRETIYSIFQVPLPVVGIADKPARAWDESAREGFYVNTIWPLCNRATVNFTKAFVPRLGGGTPGKSRVTSNPVFKSVQRAVGSNSRTIVWLDLSQAPALRRWQQSQAEVGLKYLNAGIPINQIIEKHDLPYEPVPWGDEFWIKRGLKPASWVLQHLDDESPTTVEDDITPTGSDDDDDLEEPIQNAIDPALVKLRTLIWERWVGSWAELEKETIAAMRRYFFSQRKELLRKLEAKKSIERVGKAWLDDLIPDIVGDNERLASVLDPLLRAGIRLGGEQVVDEVGITDPFELPNASYERLIGERFYKVVEINQTTVDLLQYELSQAYEANETIAQIQTRIKQVFRHCNDVRALRIARTETGASLGQGRFESIKKNKVEHKAWLTAGDEVVAPRDSHISAGETYNEAGAIPTNQPFQLEGGSVMYPCDYRGPASEIINCRCVVLAVMKGETPKAMLLRYCGYNFKHYEGQAK